MFQSERLGEKRLKESMCFHYLELCKGLKFKKYGFAVCNLFSEKGLERGCIELWPREAASEPAQLHEMQ